MSRAVVGGHAYINPKSLAKISAFYGVKISKDDVFTVQYIDTGYGRGCLHLVNPDVLGDRVILIWRGDVRPFPRCETCSEEGHAYSKCKSPNAEAVR